MANIEALRCLAMMMVVVLHYLGKGKLLGDLAQPNMGNVGIAAWLLESFCIVAVNVYMLISGYFLCMSHFKITRLIQLYLQVWIYSVGVGAICYVAGILPETQRNTNTYLTFVLPIAKSHYWFMTAYVLLYILLPVLEWAAKKMTKEQFRVVLILLLCVFSLSKSVIPVRLDKLDNKGYDCIWYICVFMVAAYFRRFGAGILEKGKRALLCYLAGVCLIFGGTMGIHLFYVKTGRLELLLEMFIEYNHVFVLLASVGLFLFALHCKKPTAEGTVGRMICKIAPYSLGVYLLHENLGLRFVWTNWFGADKIENIGALVGLTMVAAIGVFAVGILVEAIRSKVFEGIHKVLMHVGLYAKCIARLEKIDDYFAGEHAAS